VVTAAPVVQALPPIVPVSPPTQAQMSIPPLAIGPDGLPPGSINAPEGVGLPDKAEPAPVTAATGAKDDLDLMGKEQLVALAAQMGVDTKRLREAGIREKIRATRVNGSPVGTMPSGTAVTQTSSASVPSEDVFSLGRRDLIHGYVEAMLSHGAYASAQPEQLVALAVKYADLVLTATEE